MSFNYYFWKICFLEAIRNSEDRSFRKRYEDLEESMEEVEKKYDHFVEELEKIWNLLEKETKIEGKECLPWSKESREYRTFYIECIKKMNLSKNVKMLIIEMRNSKYFVSGLVRSFLKEIDLKTLEIILFPSSTISNKVLKR